MHQQRGVKGRVREQYWPGTLMALGIFAVLISVIFLGPLTFIRNGTLFRWFAFFAFAGNLMPYAGSGLRWGMERLEWFLFNLLAVGPFLLSAGLVLNFTLHGPERFLLVHGDVHPVHYWAEHGELPPHAPLKADGPLRDVVRARAALNDHLLGMADGCLGYPVLTEWCPAFQVAGD